MNVRNQFLPVFVSLAMLCCAANAAPLSIEFQNSDSNKDELLRPYIEKLTQRIERQWRVLAGSDKEVKVSLELKDNGELLNVAVLRSSGSEEFDSSAIAAVRNAAPFSRFPKAGSVSLLASFNAAEVVPPPAPDRTASNVVQQDLNGLAEQNALTDDQSSTELKQGASQKIVKPGINAPLQLFAQETGMQFDTSEESKRLAANANVPMHQPFNAGSAVNDSKVPLIPQWKRDAGYDVVLGQFHVGFFAVDKPPIPVALVANRIKSYWHGVRPEPCHIRMFDLPDNSGGYYFICLESRYGPCGWLMPMPKTKKGARWWAVYYAQR